MPPALPAPLMLLQVSLVSACVTQSCANYCAYVCTAVVLAAVSYWYLLIGQRSILVSCHHSFALQAMLDMTIYFYASAAAQGCSSFTAIKSTITTPTCTPMSRPVSDHSKYCY
jgi:hypothetical protein